MKYLVRAGVVAAIGLAAASVALATPIELTAVSGTGSGSSTSALLQNVGGGNTVTYSNSNFNGWDIKIATGISDSPSLATGALDLTVNANCLTSCDALTLAISDVGFTSPLGPNGLSTGISETPLASPASITQWAYMDTSNSYFGSTDANAMSDFLGKYNPSTASLIGMVNLMGGGYSSSGLGGVATSGPYSLTLVDQFCSDPIGGDGVCTGGVSFSSDGGITAPEPGGLALFGAGLLGAALFAGRRRSSKARA